MKRHGDVYTKRIVYENFKSNQWLHDMKADYTRFFVAIEFLMVNNFFCRCQPCTL